MPGCITKCTDYRVDSIENAWLDIRGHFGPIVPIGSTIFNNDISEWNLWAASHGKDPVTDVVIFGRWLIWKCSYGTTNYGNLPSRIRDHEGISCIPCPYDTPPLGYSSSAWDNRSELWLGFVPSTMVDHGEYYMKVTGRSSLWGFQCTFNGCPHFVNTGKPYFHV